MEAPSLTPRSIPFELGLLPVPTAKLDLENVRKLHVLARSKGDRGFPLLNYSVWRRWAVDVGRIPDDLAWEYFETFDLLHDSPESKRLQHSERVLAAKTPADLEKMRTRSSVNTFEFLLFLLLQQFGAVSLRSNAASDVEWPALAARASVDDDGSSPYGERCIALEHARLQFILRHGSDLLKVLVEPELYEAPDSDLVVPVAGVAALELLLGCSAGGHSVPLAQAACMQSEVRLNGYSKITQTFSYTRLLSWLHSRLAPPLAASPAPEPRPLMSWSPPRAVVCRVLKKTLMIGEDCCQGGELVLHKCTGAQIYILAPVKHVFISECRGCTVVVGAAAGVVHVAQCRRLTLHAACRRIICSQSDECSLYLGTSTSPLLLSSAQNITLAPYNTHYPLLEAHLQRCGLLPALNKWDQPLCTIPKGPHAATFSLLLPESFLEFAIPFVMPGETKANPFPLPPPYTHALVSRLQQLRGLREQLRRLDLDEAARQQLSSVVHQQFTQWLIETGNMRALADLHALEAED